MTTRKLLLIIDVALIIAIVIGAIVLVGETLLAP